MQNVLIKIIGIVPPPLGGVSIHIKRLAKLLDNNNIKYKIYDYFYNNDKNNLYIKNNKIHVIKKYYLIIKELKEVCKKTHNLIHIHCLNWKVIYFYIAIDMISNNKLIVTLHSFRDDISKYNLINKYFFYKALKKVNLFIVVSDNQKNKLMNYGCEPSKIITIPAYINPSENLDDYNHIPYYVKKIINNKNDFLISANGCIKFYSNQDLYGIDLLIELLHKLVINNYKVKIILALLGTEQQNDEEKKYYFKLKDKIKNYKLEEKLLIYEVKNTEFYPILEKSDLFIRPTNTDGDAISIRESIYFNVPVIASDVIERPQGTVLFKNRNFEDLYNKVIYVIENYDKCKKEVEKIKVEDNSEKILKVYEELLSN